MSDGGAENTIGLRSQSRPKVTVGRRGDNIDARVRGSAGANTGVLVGGGGVPVARSIRRSSLFVGVGSTVRVRVFGVSLQPPRGGRPTSGSINMFRAGLNRYAYRVRSCIRRKTSRGVVGNMIVAGRLDARARVSRLQARQHHGLSSTLRSCVQSLRGVAFPSRFASYRFTASLRVQVIAGGRYTPPTQSRFRLPPPPQQQCARYIDPGPLRARAADLAQCFAAGGQEAVKSVASTRLNATFDTSGQPAIMRPLGDVPAPARKCVYEVLKTVHFGVADTVACSLYIATNKPPATLPVGNELEFTLSEVKLNGVRVADTHVFEGTEGIPNVLVQRLRHLSGLRLTVRAHPTVPMGVIERSIRPLLGSMVADLRFARSMGVSRHWIVVNPLGSFDHKLCGRRNPQLKLVLETDAVSIVDDSRVVRIPHRDGHGLEPLTERLRTLRAAGGVSHVGLAVAPTIAYRIVLRVIEASVGAGYHDIDLLAFAEHSRVTGPAKPPGSRVNQ